MTRADRERVEARLLERSDAMRRRPPRTRARAGDAAAEAHWPATPHTCADCGAHILAARLAAVPDAERCIRCQRRYERAAGS